MSYLVWLVPIALGMGVVGLMAFLWSMRSGQYEDLDGAAERVLLADAADAPLHQAGRNGDEAKKVPRTTGTREGPAAFVQRAERKEQTMTEAAGQVVRLGGSAGSRFRSCGHHSQPRRFGCKPSGGGCGAAVGRRGLSGQPKLRQSEPPPPRASPSSGRPSKCLAHDAGNLRAVQPLLGHTKIEGTGRYLGIEVDGALAIAEQIEV